MERQGKYHLKKTATAQNCFALALTSIYLLSLTAVSLMQSAIAARLS